MEGLYAAMPPLELVKLLFVEAAAAGKNIMLIDIGKDHLYAPVEGEVYVDLPPERSKIGKCARLLYTLYGMRTAASSWEKEYGNTLKDAVFVIGRANTCAVWHPERGVSVVVHGDDFVIAGFENDLKYVENVLRKKYPVNMRAMLGPDTNDHKGGDANHVGKMLEEMGMQDCNTGNVPGTMREEGSEDDEELSREEAWRYWSVVARANYLAQDGPDIRFTVKELCRKMSKPNLNDWRALKKLCRYLRGRPRLRQRTMPERGPPGTLDVYVDYDWAGCRETRKSTNGGVLVVRGMCLKVWSSTQTVVARSSGEAEYCAAVKGALQGSRHRLAHQGADRQLCLQGHLWTVRSWEGQTHGQSDALAPRCGATRGCGDEACQRRRECCRLDDQVSQSLKD